VKMGSGFVIYPGRMIESNTVIIFDNDRSLIRRTVRGHDLDDIDEGTGEPRRIVYHWPVVYDDPAERRISPPASPEARDDDPDAPPAPHHGVAQPLQATTPARQPSRPAPPVRPSASLRARGGEFGE
jgi:UDP-N-acetylglucosamine diphosphorylase / glucose-1-phosphate thymidylyltransferase / UDP-N-acetylgalactosamine diphosphorylase / glucosamine-1-phosphate N-acetyltransferase / galactosamine-1-phosphate N-acetyltransferase